VLRGGKSQVRDLSPWIALKHIISETYFDKDKSIDVFSPFQEIIFPKLQNLILCKSFTPIAKRNFCRKTNPNSANEKCVMLLIVITVHVCGAFVS
jgi:hypothetical protein